MEKRTAIAGSGVAGRAPARAGSRIRRCAAAAWIALSLLVPASCSRSDPEAALREAMASLQSALEQRDAAAMQQQLADDFIGNDGLDRDGARRLAAMYLLRHRDVGVTTGPLDVDMAAEHATVRFTAVLRGGSGRALPDAAQVYDVETGWRLEGGDWKLASARWTPAL